MARNTKITEREMRKVASAQTCNHPATSEIPPASTIRLALVNPKLLTIVRVCDAKSSRGSLVRFGIFNLLEGEYEGEAATITMSMRCERVVIA